MTDQHTTPAFLTIEDATIQRFKADLRGTVLRSGDPGYDKARTLYNAMIDKHPALIVCCAGVADVISAVHFAREHQLLTAIHSGGHSFAGRSMCDDGLVIDLSPMKGIRVDPVKRTVRAEAGVTYKLFDHETQAFGLATTGGTVSATGIAGLTLGGGVGWLMRKYGLSCDNLLSVDVVTADGRFLTASATENPDLFWGMRGGGGNFGIVTSFEYRLHPVSTVLAGLIFYPLQKGEEFLRFWRDFIATAPDELTAHPLFMTGADGKQVAGIALCYCGSVEQGEQVIRPLRQFGSPLMDAVQPMPYCGLQTMLDEGFAAGFHNYWKTRIVETVGDDAINTIVAYFKAAPSPLSAAVLEHLGGAVSRVPLGDTAFSTRGQFNLGIVARWTNPADSALNIGWARDFWEAMQPFSTEGMYVNYLSGDEGKEQIQGMYGSNYARLVALKSKYDPSNFFRLNANINPAV